MIGIQFTDVPRNLYFILTPRRSTKRCSNHATMSHVTKPLMLMWHVLPKTGISTPPGSVGNQITAASSRGQLAPRGWCVGGSLSVQFHVGRGRRPQGASVGSGGSEVRGRVCRERDGAVPGSRPSSRTRARETGTLFGAYQDCVWSISAVGLSHFFNVRFYVIERR